MLSFNSEELQKIKEAINEYQTGSVDGNENPEDYRIVRTQETTDDFEAVGRWADIKRGYSSNTNWTADLVKGYQFQPGDARAELLVIDLGNCRAVVTF